MARQIQEAFIVAATRLPSGKRNGYFKSTRPDTLLAHAISELLRQVPEIHPALIEDVIVGCAIPEAQQGLNVARMGLLLAGLPDDVPGITINRFCASGLQAVADAAAKIRLGEADIMIAAGTESMTAMTDIRGNSYSPNPDVLSQNKHIAIAYGMGLTAEKVANQWGISREDQDTFAADSHRKALAAIQAGHFNAEISSFQTLSYLPGEQGKVHIKRHLCEHDEGPRQDASIERLAKLKPLFAAKGSVTAGNSSQMSDGAGAVILVSEKILTQLNLSPLARFTGYSVVGVPPEIMGIGPVKAIPKVLGQAHVNQDDLDWIELNEAFAAQALAVMGDLQLNPEKVNPLGGAIALGHPLGATGVIRTATLLHGMKRTGGKWGIVSMCVGTGMGAAGLFEMMP